MKKRFYERASVLFTGENGPVHQKDGIRTFGPDYELVGQCERAMSNQEQRTEGSHRWQCPLGFKTIFTLRDSNIINVIELHVQYVSFIIIKNFTCISDVF